MIWIAISRLITFVLGVFIGIVITIRHYERKVNNSVDNFAYQQGYGNAIEHVKNLIAERLQRNCNMVSCDDCEECCEVSTLMWIDKQLN